MGYPSVYLRYAFNLRRSAIKRNEDKTLSKILSLILGNGLRKTKLDRTDIKKQKKERKEK